MSAFFGNLFQGVHGWRAYVRNYAYHVQLPSVVKIENPRLKLSQVLMQIVVGGLCTYLFINERLWEAQVEPMGSPSFWLEMGSSHAAGVKNDLQTAKFCDSSKKWYYDYQYDAEGLWKYTDISCKVLSTRDAGIKGDTQTFVPTFMQETFVDTVAVQDLLEDGTCTSECEAQNVRLEDNYRAADLLNSFGECVCESSTAQNHFVAGAEDVTVGMELAAEVIYPNNREVFSQKSAEDNVLTIVTAEDGQVLKSIPPGESLKFKLRELLEYARVDLEDDFLATAPNQLADASRTHPSLRQTGLHLDVQLSCHNPGDRYHKHDHAGRVCYVSVHPNRRWNSRPITEFDVPPDRHGVGSYRSRYTYGVSVSFQTTGSFQYLTFSKIFPFFSSVIVYMSVPHMIMMAIALSTLGPLSDIYFASRTRTVNVHKLTYGAISRAIHRSLAYDQILELQQREDPNTTHVTASTIKRCVRKLFETENFPELDVGEVQAMANTYLEGMDDNADGCIYRREFIQYAGSEEAVTLPILAHMYDYDWKRGILQIIFDPSWESRKKALLECRTKLNVASLAGKRSQLVALRCFENEAINKSENSMYRETSTAMGKIKIAPSEIQHKARDLELEVHEFASRESTATGQVHPLDARPGAPGTEEIDGEISAEASRDVTSNSKCE